MQAWWQLLYNAKHFTSWLCLSPSNKISGGKVLSSWTRRCGSRAAALLRLAAVAVGRSSNGQAEGQINRLKTIKGAVLRSRSAIVLTGAGRYDWTHEFQLGN